MKYFLDSNVIIDVVNKVQDAIDSLKIILEEKDSEIYINQLVEMESLRTITYKQEQSKHLYTKTREILNQFIKLEMNPDIFERAKDFSRYCHSNGLNIKGKCASVDYLHFMTAKYYDLQIVTYDGDMDKLEEKYNEFINAQN